MYDGYWISTAVKPAETAFYNFRKKFTEYTGRSPIQYRNELRFAEARRLYSEGLSINEIACELGFFDAGYFSKLYKKANGHSLKSEMDKGMI